MKKIIFSLFLMIMPTFVFASDFAYEAVIDEKFYLKLEEAVSDANNGDKIIILKNVTLEKALLINKNIIIDLNNNDIDGIDGVIKIQGGNLLITGNGTIKEKEPNSFVIMIIGSSNEEDINYSTVSIDTGVTLKGSIPIFISNVNEMSVDTNGQHDSNSYGVVVDIYGNLISKKNNAEIGYGIYVDYIIKNYSNYPEINIYDNASITSDGFGIFIAGYSQFTINKATITGNYAGIAMKSGIINMNYTSINSTGNKVNPVGSNASINPTGAALQIESNDNYAGNMIINISNGNFISKNNSAILEYIGNSTTRDTSITEISINGNGTYVSGGNEPTLKFSEYFNGRFITGGNFNTDPAQYQGHGYRTRYKDNMYQIYNLWPTMADDNNNSSNSIVIIITISLFIIGSMFFLIKKGIIHIK